MGVPEDEGSCLQFSEPQYRLQASVSLSDAAFSNWDLLSQGVLAFSTEATVTASHCKQDGEEAQRCAGVAP